MSSIDHLWNCLRRSRHSTHVQFHASSAQLQHQQLHTSHLLSQSLVGGSTTHCPTPAALCCTSRSRSRCREQHCSNGNSSSLTHNYQRQRQRQAAATALQGLLQGRCVRRASGHKATHGTVAKRCVAPQWASSVHQRKGQRVAAGLLIACSCDSPAKWQVTLLPLACVTTV